MNKQVEGKKTWSNYYWYYYKWHIILIIFFGVAIAVCTAQCLNKQEPDCNIIYYSDSYISDGALGEYSKNLSKYIDDINHDGKKTVTTINCTFIKNESTSLSKANSLAAMQLQTPETCIWVLDNAGAKQFFGTDNLDVFFKDARLDSFSCHAINCKNTKSLSGLTKSSGKDFYVFFRKDTKGKITKQGKKIMEALLRQTRVEPVTPDKGNKQNSAEFTFGQANNR